MTQHYYQWLPGSENEGQVVRLVSAYVEDGEIYYEFDNGDICCEEFIAPFTLEKNNLRGKMLVEIINPNFKWKFEEIKSKTSSAFKDIEHQNGGEFEVPCINDYTQTGESINSKVGTFNIIAPKTKVKSVEAVNYKDYMSRNDLETLGLIEKENINIPLTNESNTPEVLKINSSIEHIVNLTDELASYDKFAPMATFMKNAEENVVINTTNNDNDPIAILVNSSMKYPSSVSIDLDIDLPSVSLFKTVSENFEGGTSKFIDHIIKHIDYSIITESLKEGLLNAYMQKISPSEN